MHFMPHILLHLGSIVTVPAPKIPVWVCWTPLGFFLTPCCYLMSTCETHVKCKCFWIAPNNNVPSWEYFVACIQTRLQRKTGWVYNTKILHINCQDIFGERRFRSTLKVLALLHRESQINFVTGLLILTFYRQLDQINLPKPWIFGFVLDFIGF